MSDKRTSSQREYHKEMQRLRALKGGNDAVKRLTVTEVARTLLDRQHRTATGSVTLTLNAKGDTQIEVNVPTSEELRTIDSAALAASNVYDALRAKYPRGGNGEA